MMKSEVLRFVRCMTVSVLIPLIALAPGLGAQTHVVSPADLKIAAVAATNVRQNNLETIHRLVSSAQMAHAFRTAGINTAQVKTAVSALNDQELARLAARSEKAQADFAAGRITDRDLLLIVVGIAVLVLIIVAVG